VQRAPSVFRKFAVAVCLVTIAGFEIGSLKFQELRPRLSALPRFASMPAEEARIHGSGFAFDRAFGEFLESVRRAVPPSATIALDAPLDSQPYVYGAAYVLAPRRVVSFRSVEEADFAAVFGSDRRAPGSPVGAPIRSGSLGRLR
jgi:hypothetical protein